MNETIAAALLTSLLERIDRDKTIGTVSSLEREALQCAVRALGGDAPPAPAPAGPGAVSAPVPTPAPVPEDRPAAAPPAAVEVPLILRAYGRDEPDDPDVLLCLDFGTAMSKAFAQSKAGEHFELALGRFAGGRGHALPSSVFISDDGRAYFGQEAIDLSQDLSASGRQRLDSIKNWLSLRREGNLDSEPCVLTAEFNPTGVRLTQGDLVRLYLAYLTDVTVGALRQLPIAAPGIGRYVRRRFARPCWPDARQTAWADALMRSLICEAQILADTFSGRWQGGIPVAELKSAIEEVKLLDHLPTYLIESGVPEPVAVAAGAFDDMKNLRDAFMVVDVGAGTTDFGLFVVTRLADDEDVRVFQVPASIQGLMQAGDKVDNLLRAYIAQKESIDTADNAGRMNMADLARRMRSLKEALFVAGEVDYSLPDGTVGRLTLKEFLADDRVKRFASLVEEGFRKSLEAIDESWLRWLAQPGNRLRVVLTGGSSQLPMMRALAEGPIRVKDRYTIVRERVDARPHWLEQESEELNLVYPQLAVAIGGAAERMPQTLTAPPVFHGGGTRPGYGPGRMQISGS